MDLLLPKFVPVEWLEKAWDESLKPSLMTRLIDPKDDPETARPGSWEQQIDG